MCRLGYLEHTYDKGMMDEMKLAICDDCKEYINAIEAYIAELNETEIEYDVFFSGEELIFAYKNSNADYDAIFLDMEMEEMNGIDTANKIREIDKHVIIVFITGHTKYMQESFQCSPFRFLVKPVQLEEFKKVCYEISLKISEYSETFIFLENKKRKRIFCSDIVFMESSAHSILIHTGNGEVHKIRKTMNELIKEINPEKFIRTHRAYVVNPDYIYQISKNEILLHNHSASVPLSKTFKKEFEEKFLHFKERKYLL